MICLALLFANRNAAFSGGTEEGDETIKSKQGELQKMRDEIQEYENKIKEQEKKESSTLDLLETYDKQANLLKKLIKNLHEQEQSMQLSIDSTKNQMRDLGNQLAFLKKQYADYVATLYRTGRTHDLELLLSSNSFNQLLVRSEYLRRFSDQRKADLTKISEKRDDAEETKLRLQKQLNQQRDVIDEKASEEKLLSKRMERRKQVLTELRRDKKALRQEVTRIKSDADELEKLISKLVEEERLHKERELERAREGKPPETPSLTGKAFTERRGHLRWPVQLGRVVGHFGNQENPVLHTITQNTGIDISLPSGSDVATIAEGEISAISWLPSFGNLVIIDHSGGYRTVYAHLSEISVVEGQRVGEGETIGKSGESLSGPRLHFEIWKDREKQDPEEWLSPHGLAKR